MKKFLLFFLTLLILIGCNAKEQETVSDDLYKQYQKYYQKVIKQKEFEVECADFQLQLVVNTTNRGNTRYDIIIDQAIVEMKNVQAIAVVDGEETYNSPSIGLLEEESFSLIPNQVDKEKGIYKGINLSGITSLTQFDIKLYITYKTDHKNRERFLKLHGDAT